TCPASSSPVAATRSKRRPTSSGFGSGGTTTCSRSLELVDDEDFAREFDVPVFYDADLTEEARLAVAVEVALGGDFEAVGPRIHSAARRALVMAAGSIFVLEVDGRRDVELETLPARGCVAGLEVLARRSVGLHLRAFRHDRGS